MTVDVLVPAPIYTIAGVGPYSLGHGYSSDESIVAWVREDGADTLLVEGDDYTVSPAGDADDGDVTLTATAATANAGNQLVLRRDTLLEQGWLANTNREKSLAQQLDRNVRGLQDLKEKVDRSLRVGPGLPVPAPAQPVADQVLAWGENLELINGPSVEDIEAAIATRALVDQALLDFPLVGENLVGTAFASRAIAEAASIPEAANEIMVLTPSGGRLRYKRDAAGTALTTADGQNWSPASDIYVDHFGENATPGVTPMSVFAQAAANFIAVRGWGFLRHMPTDYFYEDSVFITSGETYVKAEGARIFADHTLGAEVQFEPDAVFCFVGAVAATTTLAADAPDFAETVVVDDATGASIGDVIYFFNSDNITPYRWYTENSTVVPRSHVNRIRDIDGDTITLQSPLPRDLNGTTYHCAVTIYTGLCRVGVSGGIWDGGGFDHNVGNGRGTAAAYFNYCQDVSFSAISVHGFSCAQVWFSNTYGADLEVVSLRGHVDGYTDPIVEGQNSGFYGVWALQCRVLNLRGTWSRNIRHTIDGARTEDLVASGWSCYNHHQTPFGSHNGCDNWTYSDCHSFGDQGFAAWRGFNLTVGDCTCFAPNSAEGFVYDLPGAAGDLVRTYVLSNNRATTQREPLRLNSECECFVTNSVLRNTAGGAYGSIYVGEAVHHLQVNGGLLVSLSAAGSEKLVLGALTPRTRGLIEFFGAGFENYDEHAIHLNAEADETRLIGTDLNFDSRQGVTDHALLGGTAYRRVAINGSDAAGTQYAKGLDTELVPVFGSDAVDCTLDPASSMTWSRINNRVWLNGDIRLTSLNGATGNMKLKNLPLSVANFVRAAGGGQVVWSENLSLVTVAPIQLRAIINSVEANLVQQGAAGSQFVDHSNLTNTSRLIITMNYITDQA